MFPSFLKVFIYGYSFKRQLKAQLCHFTLTVSSAITAWKSVQIWTFFSFVFSCIWTEYADLLRKSQYSVWIQENADQKKLRVRRLFTKHLAELLYLSQIDFFFFFEYLGDSNSSNILLRSNSFFANWCMFRKNKSKIQNWIIFIISKVNRFYCLH